MVLALPGRNPPAMALVQTVWPVSKKPRPLVHKVALERVRCFRAVLLKEHGTESRKVVPTNHMWRYLSAQVIAVLDVEESNMAQGHIIVTERSLDAFHRLKGEDKCEEDQGDDEKSKKKKGKTVGFKAAHRRLRCSTMKYMKKKKNPAEADDLMETWCL